MGWVRLFMRCECGYESKEGARFCENCDAELLPAPVPSAPVPSSTSYQYPQQPMAVPRHYPPQPGVVPSQYFPQFATVPYFVQVHKYQTLGGFLLFLIVGMLLAAGSALVIGIVEDIQQLEAADGYIRRGQAMLAATYVIDATFSILQSVLEAMLAVLLIKKSKYVITVSVLGALAGVVQAICSIVVSLNSPSTEHLAFFGFLAIVLIVVVQALYMLYFFKSVRLRTYMQGDEYITGTIWKFGNPPMPAVPDPQPNYMTQPQVREL
jgi:hypothetical protein